MDITERVQSEKLIRLALLFSNIYWAFHKSFDLGFEHVTLFDLDRFVEWFVIKLLVVSRSMYPLVLFFGSGKLTSFTFAVLGLNQNFLVSDHLLLSSFRIVLFEVGARAKVWLGLAVVQFKLSLKGVRMILQWLGIIRYIDRRVILRCQGI